MTFEVCCTFIWNSPSLPSFRSASIQNITIVMNAQSRNLVGNDESGQFPFDGKSTRPCGKAYFSDVCVGLVEPDSIGIGVSRICRDRDIASFLNREADGGDRLDR